MKYMNELQMVVIYQVIYNFSDRIFTNHNYMPKIDVSFARNLGYVL